MGAVMGAILSYFGLCFAHVFTTPTSPDCKREGDSVNRFAEIFFPARAMELCRRRNPFRRLILKAIVVCEALDRLSAAARHGTDFSRRVPHVRIPWSPASPCVGLWPGADPRCVQRPGSENRPAHRLPGGIPFRRCAFRVVWRARRRVDHLE